MRFYDLLNKHSDKHIIESLKKNFNNVDEESYKIALTELRNLKPSEEKQNIRINVEFIQDDEDSTKKFLQCDGLGLDEDGKEQRWGLEFDNWEDWLAKNIEENCFKELDELTVLAGIVWELTFNGYTQSSVESKRDDLLERIRETKEHPENLVPLDLDDFLN